MGEFSLSHLLILAVIFLVFFGPSRLPQLGQSLGKAIRGFKQGLSEIEVEAKEVKDKEPLTPPTQIRHQEQASHASQTQSESEKVHSVKSEPKNQG